LTLLCSLTACGQAIETLTLTGITGLWFTEEMPGDGGCPDPGSLRVGRTYDGKDIFSLVQVPPIEESREVVEAWLRLKITENNGAQALRVGPVNGPWEAGVTRGEVFGLVGETRPARLALASGGWLQVDVTDLVKNWLGSGADLCLALFEGSDSTETVFFAGEGEDEPRLEIIIQK